MLAKVMRRAGIVVPVLALALARPVEAQVVYSGILNRAIANNATGLFVNVVTGTFFEGPGVFPTCPGPGCGYDFNLFGTTSWSFFNPGTAGQPAPTPVPETQRGLVASTSSSPASALTVGTVIGSSSTFNTSPTVAATEMLGGVDRYFGFRFRNEAGGNSVHFGWARVRLVNGAPGTLVDYAFNATAGASITVGPAVVIPEPSTYALVATGLAGLALIRRRRASR